MPAPSDPDVIPEIHVSQQWNLYNPFPIFGNYNNKASLIVNIFSNGIVGINNITVIPNTIVPYFKSLFGVPQNPPIYWVIYNSFLQNVTNYLKSYPLGFERISLITNTTPQNQGGTIINSIGRVVKSQATLQPWNAIIDDLLFDMAKQISHNEFLGNHYLHNFHIQIVFSAAHNSCLSFFAPNYRTDYFFPT